MALRGIQNLTLSGIRDPLTRVVLVRTETYHDARQNICRARVRAGQGSRTERL
jgi:hypothetical protein